MEGPPLLTFAADAFNVPEDSSSSSMSVVSGHGSTDIPTNALAMRRIQFTRRTKFVAVQETRFILPHATMPRWRSTLKVSKAVFAFVMGSTLNTVPLIALADTSTST